MINRLPTVALIVGVLAAGGAQAACAKGDHRRHELALGLARALCTDPEILLMDEPFSSLDRLIRSGMQDLLVELHDKLHKTIVFITHDLDEALHLGHQIAILKDVVLSQVGRPEEILHNPADGRPSYATSTGCRGGKLSSNYRESFMST